MPLAALDAIDVVEVVCPMDGHTNGNVSNDNVLLFAQSTFDGPRLNISPCTMWDRSVNGTM